MDVIRSTLPSVFGDMRRLDRVLEVHSRRCHPLWILADGLVSTLRGIAQVIFVNSPVAGALILAGLMCSSVLTGAAALVSVITALLFSKLFDQPSSALRAGLTSFSACLVGTVTVELLPLLYGRPVTGAVFLWIIAMSALSVPVGCGLGNILGVFGLPAFTLPFNTVTAVLFLCLRPPSPSAEPAVSAANITDTEEATILWDQVVLGSVYSMGQVYASYTLLGSVLMYLGCLMCSPILAAASYVGALAGTLLGLVFSDAPYGSVYSGVWGYNGILAAEGIMFFFVPSVRSVALALLNAIFATMIQAALAVSLKQIGLPVFTFPFVISTLLLLAASTAGSGLVRVKELRYPELHLRERPHSKGSDPESGGTSDPDPDPDRSPAKKGKPLGPDRGIGSPLPDSVIASDV